MEEKNYMKIVWVLGFIAFAAVSCWATAESLHLLLSSWPIAMCWTVTIGFFIIASLGTKLIVDSLNQDIYIEKRGWRLTGGIMLLVLFWLICSMPTNTHTFFYRTVIHDKVTSDITQTRGYLNQIIKNTNKMEQAQKKIDELRNNLEVKLGELEAEVTNELNPGFGNKSKEIFRDFAKMLEVDKIEPLTYRSTSQQERVKLCDAYRQKIYLLFENKAKSIIDNVLWPNDANLEAANLADKNLEVVEKNIGTAIDLNKAEDIKDVCDKLNKGYAAIKINKNFVNFSPATDEALYTADNPVTKTKRLIDVFKVWEDFIKGEYAGHGFLFWVIISILVDLGAFIFFDLAFKQEN